MGFPGGFDRKESVCSAGDPGLVPGLGRSPGEENGNSLQYSCLESSMERGTGYSPRGCKEKFKEGLNSIIICMSSGLTKYSD